MKLAHVLNNPEGFSLIELMVVLAIIGIMTGIALPNIAGYMSGLEITEAAQTVSGELKKARELAITKSIRTVVVVDNTTRTCSLYRQPMSGETLSGTTYTFNNLSNYYLMETINIYPKMNIGLQTKATVGYDNINTASASTHYETRFLPGGTANTATGGDAIYIMPDKEFAQNKTDKMRAVQISSVTGRIRIYTWGGTSWQ